MIIQFLGQKLNILSARARAFFQGLLQGVLDGLRDAAEDLARFALARARKLVDALRALWQQRPEEAARLIELAVKGLPAAERAALAAHTPPHLAAPDPDDADATADAAWFSRGHSYGQAIGHRLFDQALHVALSKGLASFKLGRQVQLNLRRAQMVSQQLTTLSGLLKRARKDTPTAPSASSTSAAT